MKTIDLTGRAFNMLTVLERDFSRGIGQHKEVYWKCRCDCGRLKSYRSDQLRKCAPSSCGCANNYVKIGMQIGYLLVKDRFDKPNSRNMFWLCLCQACGKERVFSSTTLRRGSNRSCGCQMNPCGQKHPSFNGHKSLQGSHLAQIRSNAKRRNLKFELDAKYLHGLFEKQNERCALSGLPLTFGVRSRDKFKHVDCTASLDRIDNEQGYIKSNVHWLHKDINKMKNTHVVEYFNFLCRSVHEYKCS